MARLFEPGNKSLKRDYPILNTYNEFMALTDKELLFVWFYACKDSPYFAYKERERVIESIKSVQDFAKDMTEGVYEQYVDRKFPSHINDAIKVMSQFEPEIRQRAKTYTDRIFNNLDYVTSLDIKTYTEVSDLKTFMDMQMGIAKNMDSIVSAAEHGFGFNKKETAKEKAKSLSAFEQE